ncbi:MAG: type II toxin-antitoxin system VapC family toxin [Rhodospirillaceae bacterium]|nr:type II toxin-antitoxin system VapC family toxin [Rhodospirillaceae bacterium]MBT4042994.1 type II toxin-antitoxin system VapC family toxin [Rhodospirillaceae bacterium]MBT4690190.1 type II toxin-antitoxin system VapC family toxin [Rhodospirillaceae bacterium]MBT5080755.1 type II toxin-antitoxin system VapC family toxin [Rhodospirillaceae bacterium]MBT5525177.1 type II toxin-antitoxin system VapC family toxin [Rhodospirillaceae bacterium]
MSLVIDASIVVNVIIPQQLTDSAVLWMARPIAKLAPEFLRIEVANALWKSEAAGLLNTDQADRAWRNLDESGIRLVPDNDHLDRARSIARGLRHSIYDCLYLAVAEANEATLLTANRRLYRLAKDHGESVQVAWIEDQPY